MPNLTIRDGGKEQIHQIEGDVATIGRAPTNTIPIGDAKASKEHCRIERSGQRWKLVDLESKNGTRVNGTFRNKAWLQHGDTIQIGQAQIRFGVEGAARRRAPAPAPAAAALAEDGGEAPPPRRRYKRDQTDKLLIGGLSILGLIIVLIVANNIAKSTELDKHNLDLIETARKMENEGQWEQAIQYLQDNAEPSGSAYDLVVEYIRDLQARIPAYKRNRLNEAARHVLSKLSRRIRSYHHGAQSVTPEEILKLVEELKTTYAGTESAELARKTFPAWFKGAVPQRAVDRLGSDTKIRRDWDEATARAQEYMKEWRFREARETIERFVSARAAVLDEAELEFYRRERDVFLRSVDQRAEGIYYAQERRARDLIKNKRYDQAVQLYKRVIERFGIDMYVRKAQAEIEKIEAMKSR